MAAPTTSMSWCRVCALFILIVNFLSSVQGELRYVTCGSVLKLQNTEHGVRLHSHDIKYGSGSGQQSVTGTDQMDDNNSHWVLKAKRGGSCPRGEPVACGSTVRLEHLTTRKNLHSHHFVSPLSNNQEISAFGDSGEGDTGDNWTVVCSSDFWERGATVRLKHVDTDMWLCASGQTYGRPIGGQMEICGLGHPASSCYWKTAEGVYLREGDATLALRAAAHTSHLHQEL